MTTTRPLPVTSASSPRRPVGPGQRQRDSECRPGTSIGLGRDLAAVLEDDLLGDRQPEARAAGLRRDEELEHVEPLRQAGPVVPDRHQGAPAHDAARNVDLAAAWHRLDGVPDEVDDDLLHLLGIQLQRRDRLSDGLTASATRDARASGQSRRSTSSTIDVEARRRRLHPVGPRELEEVADEAVEPPDLLPDHGEQLLDLGRERGLEPGDPAFEKRELERDRVERVPHLVGEPRRERADDRQLLALDDLRLGVLQLLIGAARLLVQPRVLEADGRLGREGLRRCRSAPRSTERGCDALTTSSPRRRGPASRGLSIADPMPHARRGVG